MTDQTLFSESKTTDGSDPTPTNENIFADQLKSIVNEKGEQKYQSVEDALKALEHAQKHIQTLEAETSSSKDQMAQLQAELDKRESVEDAVKRLTQPNQQQQSTEPTKPTDNALGSEDVMKIVTDALNNQRSQDQSNTNLNIVQKQLIELHGDKAAEVISKRAKELGTTPTELEKLSRSNPTMALKLLGGEEKPKPEPKPTHSSVIPPREVADDNPIPEMKISIQGGASNRDLAEAWKDVGAYTKKRLGVTD